MDYVLIDFETASATELKSAGAWRYSECPTTEVLCLGYRTPKGQRLVWSPEEPMPRVFADALRLRQFVIAHNVQFEKAIWRNIMVKRFGWPNIPDDLWHDTLASCAMRALPLRLDMASSVLRLGYEKDKVGSKFTVAMSKPDRNGKLDRTRESLQRVYDYCKQDLIVENALHERLGFLPPEERSVWLLDQKINQRGIGIDLEFVRSAQKIVDEASGFDAANFEAITGSKVSENAKFMVWLEDQGILLPNLRKETLEDLLGDVDDVNEKFDPTGVKLPRRAVDALRIRQVLGSSSIKKLKAMAACVGNGGRVRGSLQYHGTAPGRSAGRLFQPQNFPRGTIALDNIDDLVNVILTGDAETVDMTVGPPIETVISSLRHAIIADRGKVLMAGDYAGIQARVVLALAGQRDKVQMMAEGKDVYCDMAGLIFGRKITKADKAERHLGKGCVLGLGFQMGAKKFQFQFAKDHSEEDCKRYVETYRQSWAPAVPKVWYALQEAATRCVWDRRAVEAYGVTYRLEDGWLTAQSPSGRKVWYFNPLPVRKAMPWDENDVRPGFTYQALKTGQWKTITGYGGLLTENIVMRIETDIKLDGMLRLEAEGFCPILDVHDEVVCEVESELADQKAFEQIMLETPPWVKQLGIPVAVEAWTGERYRK